MKNKVVWSSICFLLFALLLNTCIHYYELLRFPERKCAQYRPLRFDFTFSHRKECIQSLQQKGQEDEINLMNMDTVQEINFRGYNATTYTLISRDGYYSSIYRISGSKISPPKLGKRSVLLFHGFANSGKSWIIQPGSRNLAFTLVNAGYEVWLANWRGTSPSLNHTHLDPDSLEYWDFGIREISTLDLPPLVELMLRETETDKLYYICHSMSCGMYLAGLVDVPELNDKIKAGFLLAPFGFYGSSYNLPMLFFRGIVGTPLEQIVSRVLGGKLSGIPSALAKRLGLTMEKICSWSFMRCGFCDNFLFAFFGADPEQMDYKNLPNIMKKFEEAGALKMGLHAVQCDVACDFRRYDYGKTRNMREYGSTEAPSYNLSGMTVPTYIFYGESDSFVTPWDAQRTKDAIPTKFLKGFYQVEWPKFNHIDFIMAKDADILVYNKIRDIINVMELE